MRDEASDALDQVEGFLDTRSASARGDAQPTVEPLATPETDAAGITDGVTDEGAVRLSITTYREGGRDTLEAWLDKRVKARRCFMGARSAFRRLPSRGSEAWGAG